MPDTIVVRPFEERDLDSTLETLRLALGETALLRRTPQLFGWKHFENPFGRSILLVADAGGHVVGLRALMRWELQTPGGDIIRCVRAVDTATHPDYRRQGIFRRLTLEALDRALHDGVDLVFNTPNPHSAAGYLSMGWTEVGEVGVMVSPTWRLLRRRPISEELPRSEDLLPDARPAAGLTVSDRRPRGLRTPRSDRYLRWRFGRHPTASYVRVDSLRSTAVLRPNFRDGRTELVVADVFGDTPGDALAASRRRSRAAYLVGWFSAGSPERRAALRAGLLPVPRIKAMTLIARPLRRLPVDVAAMGNWDLALSDLELL